METAEEIVWVQRFVNAAAVEQVALTRFPTRRVIVPTVADDAEILFPILRVIEATVAADAETSFPILRRIEATVATVAVRVLM